MSQFTLTLEEDALITDALKAKATQYAAMFGVADPSLEALIAKLECYNPEVVAVEEEKPAKAKKAKAAAEAAFLDGVPHEQHTED
jgi:hypothetical protein